MEKEKNLDVNLYVSGNGITLNGVEKSYKGIYYLECEGNFLVFGTEINNLPDYLFKVIEENIKPNVADKITFNFPVISKNVPLIVKGYFGRKDFVYGVQILKPLDKLSKDKIKKEIMNKKSLKLNEKKSLELILN